MLRKLRLLLRTTWDLKPSQVSWRIYFLVKRKLLVLFRVKVKKRELWFKPNPVCFLVPISSREQVVRASEKILKGEFEFLNRMRKFSEVIDWKPSDESRLWTFTHHYCIWAADLSIAFRLTGDQRYLNGFKQLVLSWINGNIPLTGDGWHPYPISLRVCNWIIAAGRVWDSLEEDQDFCSKFLGSLWEQIVFLKQNLEFDLRGNHLLENSKALIIGGIFFGVKGKGADFFRRGQKVLERQLPEQIFPDGGHFERSPMYHCIILEDLLMILEAYHGAGLKPAAGLEQSIRRMTVFLQAMTLPNDRYPNFNDSAPGMAPLPEELINRATLLTGMERTNLPESILLESTGYARLTSSLGDVVIFNCGDSGPKYQPGHAHADTLSFEWTLHDGTQVFIDSGVYEYTPGRWRDYFRGTRAHNTVQIDGENSTEVWGGFRAARKARAFEAGFEKTAELVHAFGGHDGFRHLSGKPAYRRDIFLFKDGILIVIDTVSGTGKHLVESRLHLNPDWTPIINPDSKVTISNGSHKLLISFIDDGNLSIGCGKEEPIIGWYSAGFGKKEPTSCIVWSKWVTLPLQTGFICHSLSIEPVLKLKETEIEIDISHRKFVFDLGCVNNNY